MVQPDDRPLRERVTTDRPLRTGELRAWPPGLRDPVLVDDRPVTVPLAPSVTVAAEYPATDGRAPERIEVRWETAFPGATTIVDVVAALAKVAQDRWDRSATEATR